MLNTSRFSDDITFTSTYHGLFLILSEVLGVLPSGCSLKLIETNEGLYLSSVGWERQFCLHAVTWQQFQYKSSISWAWIRLFNPDSHKVKELWFKFLSMSELLRPETILTFFYWNQVRSIPMHCPHPQVKQNSPWMHKLCFCKNRGPELSFCSTSSVFRGITDWTQNI